MKFCLMKFCLESGLSSGKRLSSKVMTCGLDWWEETMIWSWFSTIAEYSESSACLQSADSSGMDGGAHSSQ